VVPRAEQTDTQLKQAEAAQDLIQYQEIPAATQTEGKPLCMIFYV
jgi:hypothetical protein